MGLYQDYCRHYVDSGSNVTIPQGYHNSIGTSDIYMDHKRYNDFIRNGGIDVASYWPSLPCYSHKDAKIIGNVKSIGRNWDGNNFEISLNLDPTEEGIKTLKDICTRSANYKYGLGLYLGEKEKTMKLTPKKVIFNEPATIVFWEDGTKTIVKCSEDDEFNPYYGFCAALAKKVYGNSSRVRKIVDKWAPEEEEPLNDTAKAFKTVMESVQSLAERFNKATNDKE